MKIAKPMKVPILTRVVERGRRPELHIAAMLGFPLASPRALLDELAFWAAVSTALGANGAVDEGFAKVRGEMLVAGSFHAPGGVPLPASYVRACVGSVDKRVAVIGDRSWRDGVFTDPVPMTTMPIDWAHAFGGAGFDRNPYGKGAALVEIDGERVRPLPNIEPYVTLLRAPSERPEPAGLLPMDITFAQRRARGGTYDQRWLGEHFPGLPPDADATFFNAAPEDQWATGYFTGNEDFALENMHPDMPRIEGRLPGLAVRAFATQRTPTGEGFVEVPLHWDTVWLFPSTQVGVLIAHGTLAVVDDDAADVLHLVCACEDPARPRAVEHYRGALARRLDKDMGAIAGLSDSDLMPPRESGVAPNIGETDIGRWVKGENVAAKNAKRGAERWRASRIAMAVEEGMDPKALGLLDVPAEPEPPPDDLDELAAQMEAQLDRLDTMAVDLDAKATENQARARAQMAELGEGDAPLGGAARAGVGPPRLIDDADLDPDVREHLQRQHQQLIEMYRRYGHLQPTADVMDPEEADRARIVVELTREGGESLAERDLTGAKLAGMDLRGLDFSRAFLEAADLSGCNLSGANLEGAVLAKADMRRADLTGARLHGANLGGALLADAVLEGVDLSEGILSRAELAGARITHANLTGVDWLETRVGAVDLSGSTLGECNLIKSDLSGARLVGVDLSGANLVECMLDGADLSHALLNKTSFVSCKGRAVSFREASFRQGVIVHCSSFPEADATGAEMQDANLRGTALAGARFDRADLTGADLSECDTTGASFEHAKLQGGMLIRTNLTGASLRGVNLMDALASKARIPGADLTGSNLYRADLSRVIADDKTKLAGAEVRRVRFLPLATVPKGNAT